MTQDTNQSLRIAIIFAAAVAVVNGFGRFAYALLLPIMREDLAWNYVASGWLNAANSVGYGLGALIAIYLLSQFNSASLFRIGLAMAVLTLLLCGVTQHFELMLLWRFLCGVGSSWVFSCGGALIAARYSQSATQSARAIAIYYAGGGLGIALSSVMIFPVLNHQWNWPAGWLLLGFAGLLLSIWPAKLAATMGAGESHTGAGAHNKKKLPWRRFQPLLWAYFFYGVGYIVYLTFAIAWLREMHLETIAATGVWLILGMAAICSGYVWRGAIARWPPTRTFAAATLCNALGTALPLASKSIVVLLVSAVLVGGSFFMVPGAVMALIRSVLPQTLWAKAMNSFTMVFAVGQGIGPVIAGWMADTAGMNAAMAAGAVVLVLSAALSQVKM